MGIVSFRLVRTELPRRGSIPVRRWHDTFTRDGLCVAISWGVNGCSCLAGRWKVQQRQGNPRTAKGTCSGELSVNVVVTMSENVLKVMVAFVVSAVPQRFPKIIQPAASHVVCDPMLVL